MSKQHGPREVRLPRHKLKLRSWATWLYNSYPSPRIAAPPTRSLSVVCLADTHNTKPELPDGDLLLHAGDLTEWGSFDEIQAQLDWLESQPHRHKVVIAGNHDILLDEAFLERNAERFGHYRRSGKQAKDLDFGSLIYLRDTPATLEFKFKDSEATDPTYRKVKIYGSPTTPMYGVSAFQVPRDQDVWTDTVPKDTDIFLTHGPPYRHLDGGLFSGCSDLAMEVARVRPRLVVFGHIHVGREQEDVILHPVRAAYEGIIGAWEEWPGLFMMAVRVGFAKFVRPRNAKVTTMVNAAVVGGEKNAYHMEPIVVQI